MKKQLLTISLAASVALAEVYNLGQVNIAAKNVENVDMLSTTIKSETIERDNSIIVSEALDNIAGLNQDMQGGRGEGTLYMRGFNAQRIGVFIDGIPIYVPYDGNFDYARFLTNDIAQIDVSKGLSSVAYGGNTMAGVVNIVSKKPTKVLEGNVRGMLVLDSALNQARHIENINVGTMQDGWYAQLGASYSKQDHFRMSGDYEATPTQPEGDRLRSESEDKKVSLKAGYVADDGSEIALSYANQQGQKQQPPTTDTAYSQNKNWDWPYWDKETISLAAQKNFDSSYLKALVYHDTFKNSLYSYKDATFTSFAPQGFSFKSRYDDYSYGSRLEYGIESGDNLLKFSFNYKKDVHRGYDIGKFNGIETMTENYEDQTFAYGVEDNFQISKDLELIAGVSYDMRKGDKIFDTNTANLDMLSLTSEDALSPQAALLYTLDATSKLRASISQKTYMPSMKDRYSRRLGTAVPNVDLKNELATHYELGYKKIQAGLTTGVNLFYTNVKDAIQSEPWDQNTSLMQNQNIGTFDHLGAELELEYAFESARVGGNYTRLHIENTEDNDKEIVDVPKHQLFFFAQKELQKDLSVYANMKHRSGALENKLDRTYATNPNFTTFDVKLTYDATKELRAEVGIKNLTDELVRYDYAFPMAGREYFATLDYRF